MKHRFTALVLVGVLAAGAAMAEVPGLINYQGRLRDNATGLPMNGNVSVQIAIYTNETGGAWVYNQNIGTVPITNGVYSFNFGSNTLVTVLSNPECWLSVTVDGNILTPRQRLVAVPYAVVAGTVQGDALFVDSAGRVGVGTNQPVFALDVHRDNYNAIRAQGTSDNSVGIYIKNAITNGGEWGFTVPGNGVLGGSAAGSLMIWQEGVGPRLSVSKNGRVGVNTVPQTDTSFHVKTSTNSLDRVTVESLSGGFIHFIPQSRWGEFNSLGLDGSQKIVFSGGLPNRGSLAIVPWAPLSAGLLISSNGNVGVSINEPARPLHVNDVMRLQPRSPAPSSPAEGDIYMDSTTHKLMVYDGSTWRACW